MAKKKSEKKGAPQWMATFSDLMSLLLTFFVLLFSLSTIIIKKEIQALGPLSAAFGGLPAPFITETIPDRKTEEIMSRPHQPVRRQYYAKEEIRREEEQKVKSKDLTNVVKVTGTEEGITFRLSGDVAFERDSAQLTEDGISALMHVSESLNRFPNNPIKIEGHTDNTGRTSRNWELSAQRAFNAMEFLIEWGNRFGSVDERRFSYEAFAQFDPLPEVDPNTAIGRSLNRRVEIVLVQTDQGFETAFEEGSERNPRSPLVDPDLLQEPEQEP